MSCAWLLIFVLLVRGAVDAFQDEVVDSIKHARNVGRITNQCNEALALFLQNLNSTSDDEWGLKMLDATSKIPVGLLFSLNFGELGQFKQCLDTESLDGVIKGKYCLGTLSISNIVSNSINANKTDLHQLLHLREVAKRITHVETRGGNMEVSTLGPTWAICLPSDCSDEDVGEILQNLIGSPGTLCQTKDDLSPSLTVGATVAIVILSFIAFALVASTICDLIFTHYKKREPLPLLVAFSVHRNGRKLFKTSENSAELSCLNGIKLLSMLWVIIGHVYSTIGSTPVLNFKDIVDWLESLQSMIMLSGTLSVDSFFLVGGALVVYGFMKAKHKGVNFNLFHFYLHRYLRLTPALAAAILVNANLVVYMGSGPMWGTVDASLQQNCQKYWWSTLLYLQNYVNDRNMCLAQTWYLSVDMQLYILSPLILLPLWRYPKIGVTLVISLITIFIIVPFVVAYNKELSGLLTNFYPRGDVTSYMLDYYYKTHTRAAPWIMGALLGYVLAQIKFLRVKIPEIRKTVVILLWAVCIAVMLTCVFAGHSTLRGEEFDRWGNAFYIALVRPAWSLCLAWVILACVLGYGGPINSLLSFPVYQVLNRFTYSMYLVHLSILSLIALASKTGVYYSFFHMAYTFWGITMFSFGLSILWVLAFESPVIVIEKVIFKGLNKIASCICGRCQKSEEMP